MALIDSVVDRLRRVERQLQTLTVKSARSEITGGVSKRTVAQINAINATTGALFFATDGRKTGEGAGLGTGVLAYYDGTAWRRVDDGTTLAS